MATQSNVAPFAFALCIVILCPLRGTTGAEAPSPPRHPTATIYHTDAEHLWNRVHAALMMRTGPDGQQYGHDRLEPLLWRESRHLLAIKSGERAIVLLEQFDRDQGETLIADHAQRAILQRDLWLVNHWLAESGNKDQRLERALGNAIRRLALSPAQIAALPDNYAAAVVARKYAEQFDPDQPEQAYLPPDLFDPAGPWVCVGPVAEPVARFHLPAGNSVFLVFLKLPKGRDQTLKFISDVAALDQLLAPNDNGETRDLAPVLPHPQFPQWPPGTEVALVRRMLLIDTNHRVVPSPVTEGVQIRVVTAKSSELTKEVLQLATARRPPPDWQATFEFQLRRVEFFAGTAGGLRDVSAERDFKTGFNAHRWDEFDRNWDQADFLTRSQPFVTNRASCQGCHNFPGVYSFNSLPGFAFGVSRDIPESRPDRRLGPLTINEAEKRAVGVIEKRPEWQTLVKVLGKQESGK